MIAITGANGQLGKTTIGFLLKQTKPENIVAIVRDPEKIQDYKNIGIQIRVADYDNLASLNEALKNIEKVLQISTIGTGEQAIRQENNVVKAAQQQGVKHIVYTSALKPSSQAHFFATQICSQTEKAILDTGITYTFFRNSLYMETIPQFIGNALQDGNIYFPAGNGKVSFVSRTDIAQALSLVLTTDTHKNKKYEITGSQAFSFQDVAAIVSSEKDLSVTYTDIPNSVLSEQLAEMQMPLVEIDWMLSLADSIKANEFAYVDNTLETLLLRKPLAFQEYLKSI